jgi:uncharacterized membrane protein YfcA
VELLIVCPLALIAGFVDAIAGGGGLISLPAYLFAGLPVHQAIGTNKLSSTMGTLASTWRFAKHGYLAAPLVLVGVCCGLTGSFCGSNLVLLVGDTVIKWLMLAALPLIMYYVLRTRDLDRYAQEGFGLRKTLVITAIIAAIIGVYDGFYGPGTGTFLILLLTSCAHLDLRTANGTTKAINLATNVTALVVFAFGNVVLVGLGLVAGVFNIIGNLLGAHLFAHDASRITRPIIIVVVIVFAIRLLFDLLGTPSI